jgi:hypothetical protein
VSTVADFVSQPFPTAALRAQPRRVDVELHRVDQAVPSYEGRIFLQNRDADRDTPRTEEAGYLGAFFVFGKVDCWGEDEGHCHPASGRKYDRRRPPGRHAKIRVTAPTDRLERLLLKHPGDVTLSIVAVASADRQADAGGALRFGRLSLVTYG